MSSLGVAFVVALGTVVGMAITASDTERAIAIIVLVANSLFAALLFSIGRAALDLFRSSEANRH